MKLKNRIAFKIFVVIVIIFIVYSVLWYINSMFYEYPSKEYGKFDGYYVKTDMNGFSYTLSRPGYVSFTGNYAITNADDTLSVLIWPRNLFNNDNIYGVQIYDEATEHGYMFYVDSDFSYIETSANRFSEDDISQIRYLLDLNTVQLKQMHRLIKNEWKL